MGYATFCMETKNLEHSLIIKRDNISVKNYNGVILTNIKRFMVIESFKKLNF